MSGLVRLLRAQRGRETTIINTSSYVLFVSAHRSVLPSQLGTCNRELLPFLGEKVIYSDLQNVGDRTHDAKTGVHLLPLQHSHVCPMNASCIRELLLRQASFSTELPDSDRY